MAKTKKLVLFGNGEFATLARFYFDRDSEYEVVAYAVDDEFAKENSFDGLPLIKAGDLAAKYPPACFEMHVAVSYKKLNRVRAEKCEAMRNLGYTLASYMCSKSVFWEDLEIGDNCFILENQTIQPTVKIGNNAMIWSGNHIGHGTVIADNNYISSHVVISGHVEIASFCFFGVNSAVRDFAKIGEGSFIAMNAAVTRDIAGGSVVIGGRGTTFAPESKEAKTLMRKYFGL